MVVLLKFADAYPSFPVARLPSKNCSAENVVLMFETLKTVLFDRRSYPPTVDHGTVMLVFLPTLELVANVIPSAPRVGVLVIVPLKVPSPPSENIVLPVAAF
jgi:hypothetical protein